MGRFLNWLAGWLLARLPRRPAPTEETVVATLQEILAKVGGVDAAVKAATGPIATLATEHAALVAGDVISPKVQAHLDELGAAVDALAADAAAALAPLPPTPGGPSA